jgi:poly-gamma-glutamate synthesis protein (capsule biosynthesis protein)
MSYIWLPVGYQLSPGNDITVSAVGDLMLGDSPKCVGFGVRSVVGKLGARFLFREIEKYLEADVVFGNLECVLSDHDYRPLSLRKAQMRGVPSSVWALKAAGFNAINVANNHNMQHGVDGFLNTCKILEEVGIGVIGKRSDDEYLCEPLVMNIKDRFVGILGYSMEKDNYWSGVPLYALGNREGILRDVRKLCATCDHVIVSLHWEDEFMSLPSCDAKRFSREIIDEGASIILGHHPHVIQCIDCYKGGLICYSLGNCVSDMLWDERLRNGILLKIVLKESKVEISNIYNTFIRNDYSVAINEGIDSHDVRRRILCEGDEMSNLDYRNIVLKYRKINRNLSHLYILKNICKYHPWVLTQIMFRSLCSAFFPRLWIQ